MVSRRLPVVLAISWVASSVAACTFDTRDGVVIADAAPIDAAADAPAPPAHLLLSEIKSSNDVRLREFIEIINPTPELIDLSSYYLSDDKIYARLPAISAGEAATIEQGDFVARFPTGSVIGPGEIIVVALRSTDARPFIGASFAVAPADNTPPMEPAFPASISSTPALQNDDGEGIVLFRWDGASDLVTDVDMFKAGFRFEVENALANKTGLSVDGPDADNVATAYATDSDTMPSPIRSNGINEAFVRIAGEQDELTTSGNGTGGHDETSENILASWSFAIESPGSSALSF